MPKLPSLLKLTPLFKLQDFAILAAFLALAAVSRQTKVDLHVIDAAPTLAHPLGMDNLGRDLLARLSEAIRLSVLPLWLAVAGATLVGIALAAVSILLRERSHLRPVLLTLDATLTVIASIPVTVTAFAWAACLEEASLRSVLLSLSTVFAIRAYLVTKDLARQDAHLGYWTAHKALGGTLAARVWAYGIRSRWTPALLSCLGLHLRAAVAVEASLSYLGFGVQEPTASFGNILAAHFASYLKGHYSVLALTAAALALTAAAPSALARILNRRLAFLPRTAADAIKPRHPEGAAALNSKLTPVQSP